MAFGPIGCIWKRVRLPCGKENKNGQDGCLYSRFRVAAILSFIMIIYSEIEFMELKKRINQLQRTNSPEAAQLR